MREILFRGKRVDNGEWVDGFYVQDALIFNESPQGFYPHAIWDSMENEFYLVIPETVGQYTGLHDKNGTKIFEGDIVRILYTDWFSKPDNDPRTLAQYKKDISTVGSVGYRGCEFGLHICSDYLDPLYEGKYGEKEILGNIHDNPELLEAQP